jgi:eukaryotic-like serine/threonine-protein kinase
VEPLGRILKDENMEIKEDIDQLLQARSEIDAELRRFKTKQTVLFTDIVGSTTYFDRFGDTAGLLLLYKHDSLVMGAVEEFKGNVVKTIGDSVMAEFTDPLSAVQAAIAIQRRLHELNQNLTREERMLIRIGINDGFGFRRANDLFGDVVNVAARITKRSGAAQILISESVTGPLAEGEILCRSIGYVNLQGKTNAEELFEVIWTEPSDYDDLRGSLASLSNQRDKSSHGARLEEFVRSTSGISELEEPAKLPVPPSLTERYEVISRLGAGGMGVVYKAKDRETGETVALKVLNPEIADSTPLMDVFRNEIRVARRITHKNVCRIYDFSRTDDSAFISMEFVQGETLRCVLDRFNALTPRNGIRIALEICDALNEVHAQGIVHRDIKPQNLMIDGSGNVKLMDFGLAHVVDDRSTAAAGTPSYMAPEQANGRHIDQRADIYSLGLVLFEVFTGSPVFAGNTPLVDAFKQQCEGGQVEHHVPEYIARAILRCLEKDPANRFQSVQELRGVLSSDPATASLIPWDPPTSGAGKEHWKNLIGLPGFLKGQRYARTVLMFGALLLTTGIVFLTRAGSNVQAVQASPQLPGPQGSVASAAEVEQSPPAPEPQQVVAVAPAPPEIRRARSDNPSKSAVAETPAAPVPTPINRRPGWTALIETVSIPAGVFMMGNDNGRKEERPRHQVKLDAFNMSRTEITNRQYLAFLDSTSYPRPKDPSFAKDYLKNYPDLPVVNVSYEDAVAFCAWASKKFDAIIRLPTEAEWEFAALAGRDDALFSWGTLDSKSMARFKANLPRGAVAVVSKDAFPANRFGLYNMNGNAAEWVSDYYSRDYYTTSPIRNPAGPASGSKRVVKGGSWADNEDEILTSRRASRNPGDHSDEVGFRVVALPPHTGPGER